MAEFPIEGAVEQELAVVPDDDADPVTEHGDDVDPAEAYVEDRLVPVDEDEWR